LDKQSFITKVVLHGRITIPENVRDVLGLKTGTVVNVTVEKIEKVRK
jgi:AbrB family looped-hinge helix DNA binding protein